MAARDQTYFSVIAEDIAETVSATVAEEIKETEPGLNAQTGTTYTLALDDAASGALLTLSNAEAITLTVPLNAAVAFPINSVVHFAQLGAGLVTVSGENGETDATINPANGGTLALTGQYAQGVLRKVAEDTWLLTGDLEPSA